ncbi:MAG: VPA1269 family protein [Colwellia sp.]|nr:VPA1269 family protein [Colwellia sp.]
MTDFYPSIQEASAAAISLGIKTFHEYKKNYKEDPHLPSDPNQVYKADLQDFGGMDVFLGGQKKYFYPSIQEASAAAISLGIKNFREYKKNYKKDPYLPSDPHTVYKADMHDFGGMVVFLGGPKKDFYPTIEEASSAAIALGIRTFKEYSLGYKKDPRLSSIPYSTYSDDWDSFGKFPGFLGKKVKVFYLTIEEASVAAKALGIDSIADYYINYRQDPRLPSEPSKRYAADWKRFGKWVNFLDLRGSRFYPTIEEASAATIALGINTYDQYIIEYKKDPKLPSNPSRIYAADWAEFDKWVGFFNGDVNDFYPSIVEASEATIALNIKTINEYNKNYSKDPRLPSNPREYYADDWITFGKWVGLLAGEVNNFYTTIEEASTAAIALGITTAGEYSENHRKDPRLPSKPDQVYAIYWDDFGRMPGFLGGEVKVFYSTINEASTAAKALGISTRAEYQKLYKKDPRLPSTPSMTYAHDWADFGGFIGFLGGEAYLSDEDITEDYKAWKVLYLSFIDEVNSNLDVKIRSIREYICSFIIANDFPHRPEEYLLRTTKFDKKMYEDFLTSRFTAKKKSPHHTSIVDFLQYCLIELCTFNDEDEKIIHPDYRNPLQSFSSDILDIKEDRLDESNKPVLAYIHMCSAKQWIIPTSAKNIGDLTHLHEISEQDWFDVPKSLIDKKDPNCVYRRINKESRIDRKMRPVWQIWSPVRFLALYVLLKVPARGQQILWCDSGEADLEVPEFVNGKVEWHTNLGPLAKFANTKEQGFIKQYTDGEVGLHFTTNKTSRTEGGYDIPWIPDFLAEWMIKLRKWQSKYNPISKPSKWLDITTRRKIAKSVLKLRGENCFLFRQPNDITPYHQPIFKTALPYVLNKIEKKDNPLTIKLNDNCSLSSYATKYTPHSMRVSLITAFVVDAKVPLEIVQKLVGHARIVMTLYYTKVGLAKIRDELSSADKRALAQAPYVIQQQIRDEQIEKIKNSLTANNPNYLDGFTNQYPTSAYSFSDIGICPMGGGRCSTGGKLCNESSSNKVYAPVEAGHLGMANCIRCRFFITSPAYLGGLTAVANEIYLKQQYVQKQERDLLVHINILVDEEFDCEQKGKVFTHSMELEKNNTNLEQISQKIDMYAIDGVHLIRLIDKAKSLLQQSMFLEDGSTENLLMTNSQEVEINWSLDETCSEFHQLSTVCENATIYAISDDSIATPRRTQLLDKMIKNNGIEPGMFLLSLEEQLAVGNQMSSLLIDRFKSWESVESLIQGELYLDDLDDLTQKPIKDELKRLMLAGGNKKLKANN